MTRRTGSNAVVAVDFVARTRIDNPSKERTETEEVNFHSDYEFAPTIAVSGPGGTTMTEQRDSVSSGPDPLVGTTLEPHRYEITRVIGQGGFGTVYEAKKQPLGRRVAIKRLAIEDGDKSEALARFEREANILAKLEHPCIVSVFEFFKNSDGYFIVMEFVEGKPLSDLIATQRLTYEFILRVMRKAFSAVAEGHKHGIIHRDLKAENIVVLERDDGELVVKVLDYGIARVTSDKGLPGVDAAYTKYGPGGFFAGTPYYMAPEVATGKKASEQTDVYALGVLMYYAVTNSLPYTVGESDDVDTGGNLLAILSKQMSSDPIEDIRVRARGIGRDVPDKLADAIMKALAKDPVYRWKSVVEFRDAVEEAAMDLIGRASAFYSRRPSRSSAVMPEPAWSKHAATFGPESLKLPMLPTSPADLGEATTIPSDRPVGFRAAVPPVKKRPMRGVLTGILAVLAVASAAGVLAFWLGSGGSRPAIEEVEGNVEVPAVKTDVSAAMIAMAAPTASVSGAATIVRAPAASASAPLPESAKRSLDACLDRPLRGNPGCAGFCDWCGGGGKHSYCSTSCLLAGKK